MATTRIKCPTCGREVAWESAPFRPFCSERCRLVDLGAWLSEKRSIPGEAPSGQEASPVEDEEAAGGPPPQGGCTG